MALKQYVSKLWRTKNMEGDLMKTELKRCLTTFDMTMMGIATVLGSGPYVLVGVIAREVTGPALFLSCLIAGFAHFLTSTCFAELGSRIPKTGSAYIYAYAVLGELIAFVVGWSLLLEHIMAASMAAKGVVAYIDDATSEGVMKATPEVLERFDLYSVVLVILITIIACIGVKLTSLVNDALSLLNLATLTFVTLSGFILADWSNWSDDFMPYGISSIFTGAAEIYFASGGYDVVNIATVEAINPAKSVPVALFTAVGFITVLLCSISASVTLMIPYKEIAQSTALSQALEYNGWGWASALVTVGAVVAMTSTVMANTICSSRIIYGMASEGLIFRGLSRVNKLTQVPIWATLVASTASAVVAFFINIEDLAQMLAFGALLAFSCVALVIIKIRCDPSSATFYDTGKDFAKITEKVDDEKMALVHKPGKEWGDKHTLATGLFITFMMLSVCCLAVIQDTKNDILFWVATGLFFIVLVLMIATIVYLWFFISDPAKFQDSNFRVPLVPPIPVISIFVNLYLITQLTAMTWLRSGVWLIIGSVIYFTYGVRNSGIENESKEIAEVPDHESKNNE